MQIKSLAFMVPDIDSVPAKALNITKTLPKAFKDKNAKILPNLLLWKNMHDCDDTITQYSLGKYAEEVVASFLHRCYGWTVPFFNEELKAVDLIIFNKMYDKAVRISVRRLRFNESRNTFEGKLTSLVSGHRLPITTNRAEFIVFVAPYEIYCNGSHIPLCYVVPVKDIESAGLSYKMIFCPHRNPSIRSVLQSKLNVENYFCNFDLIANCFYNLENSLASTTSHVFKTALQANISLV